MTRKIPDCEVFMIERDTALKLAFIERQLHGDGSTLTPDARRDLANLMSLILNDRLHPALPGPEEEDISLPDEDRGTCSCASKALFFKTGRFYTDHGQRIAAQRTPDSGILFYDMDRMIEGHISKEVIDKCGLGFDRDSIMYAYDHHEKSQYWVKVYEHDEQMRKLKKAAREHDWT